MAPNLIRECDAAYRQLASLGADDQLSPELAAALCRRLVGALSEMVSSVTLERAELLTEDIANLVRRLTFRASELHRTALIGLLTAELFERMCNDMAADLMTLRVWWEGIARAAAYRIDAALARTPITVYQRAGRRFAVIDGGRA